MHHIQRVSIITKQHKDYKMNFPYKIIDLSHILDEATIAWDGNCGFEHILETDYADCASEVPFRVQKIKMPAGIGTHIDAPAVSLEEKQ